MADTSLFRLPQGETGGLIATEPKVHFSSFSSLFRGLRNSLHSPQAIAFSVRTTLQRAARELRAEL